MIQSRGNVPPYSSDQDGSEARIAEKEGPSERASWKGEKELSHLPSAVEKEKKGGSSARARPAQKRERRDRATATRTRGNTL